MTKNQYEEAESRYKSWNDLQIAPSGKNLLRSLRNGPTSIESNALRSRRRSDPRIHGESKQGQIPEIASRSLQVVKFTESSNWILHFHYLLFAAIILYSFFVYGASWTTTLKDWKKENIRAPERLTKRWTQSRFSSSNK